jgi:hypothetical protein
MDASGLTPRLLKRGLVLFWGTWHTLVALTNACDWLKSVGLLQRSWPLASGNERLIAEATAKYGAPRSFSAGLLLALTACQAAAAVLFWRAGITHRRGSGVSDTAVNSAFVASLGLWMAVITSDELFVAYETGAEAAHFRLFTAQLLSLLTVHILPD